MKIKQTEAENFDELFEDEEIPDEYLDPISCDLMKEPVRLPTSGNIMDLITIKK